MTFQLMVSERKGTKNPLGFDCGKTDLDQVVILTEDLRVCLRSQPGNLKVHGPELDGDKLIVTVRCDQDQLLPTIKLITPLVNAWKRHGLIKVNEA